MEMDPALLTLLMLFGTFLILTGMLLIRIGTFVILLRKAEEEKIICRG